ncbi:MAG: GntR family transcriptional regulator [bacterium]
MVEKVDILNYQSLTDRIYEILKDRIIRGELEHGTRLIEEDIAREFGVSRTPVREAINRLKASGLVNALPRRSVYVAKLTPQDITDISDLREVLERFAAELALPNWGEEDTRNLNEIAERCLSALAEGDIALCFELDSQFHQYIAKRSGNRYLLSVLEGLDDYIQFARWLGCDRKEIIEKSLLEHRKIVSALSKQNVDGALKLMSRHIQRAARHYIESAGENKCQS